MSDAHLPQSTLSQADSAGGARVPALSSNRILWRDGLPVAVHTGGQTQFFMPLDPPVEWTARNALLHKRITTVGMMQ